MSLASIEGATITSLRCQVPAWGRWWCDVTLDQETDLSGSVTITLADITLVGTIVDGGDYDGQSAYRIVGGAGGWGADIAEKGYASDSGVKISTVLTDAAAAAGETISGASTTRLGPHYTRTAGPASRLLHELAPQAWYMGLDGVTYFGSRADTTYDGDGPRVHVSSAINVIDLATEELSALVPGVQVDGSNPATDVEYVLTDKRLTVRVYAGAVGATSRRMAALAKMLEALDPLRRYRGTFEFRVVTQSGDRLNLQPVRSANGLPDLARVPTRGPAGIKSDVLLGSLVLVTFVDADPSRPVVYAHDAPDAPGWNPSTIALGSGTDPVIRASDLEGLLSAHNNHQHTSGGLGNPTTLMTHTAGDIAGSTKVTAE